MDTKQIIDKLQAERQAIIDKIKEDINRFQEWECINELSVNGKGMLTYAQEILNIIEGENK